MIVMKRNGQEDQYMKCKIHNAVDKAVKEVAQGGEHSSLADVISNRLDSRYRKRKRAISVEDIQDDVETELMKEQAYEVAKAYIRYRHEHELMRNGSVIDGKILTIVDGVNEEVIQENSNKNPTILSTQRDYIAGEVSKDISNRVLIPEDIRKAHEEGIIHFHDSDYFVQRMHNCCLVNLEDMLQNGTVISGTMIEKPHSFSTACNIATQIIAQVASCQYGGQSISLAHLAPFVDVSRKKIQKQVIEEYRDFTGHEPTTEAELRDYNAVVNQRLREEVKRGVQTIQYQVVTLMTTNGQAPFITVFMYLGEVEDEQTKNDLAMIIEEVVLQRYEGVKNEKGAWITPAFPKLIYVLEEDNITEDSEYWYLTRLCARCSAKRLVPDYISEKVMLQNKIDKNGEGHCYTCMGCRSFLTPYLDENGKPKYYGRFNQGVVTINLPDVGLSARQRMIAEGITYVDDEQWSKTQEGFFWEIFEERLELCHRALRLRHERLLGTLSDASPIHWQNGALARLEKGETIDKLLYGGYSTLSLGYAGLYECVKAMTGKSHTDEEAKPFALAIMQHMNDKCKEWKEAENIDYSLYGTPIESTTYKFAKSLQKRFGVIEGITDKGYITNSYHVHVSEKINAFDKLQFEAEFQLLSPGGAISYIETANLNDNIEAVLAVIKYIYEHIMYAELNTKSDFCQVCGYDGEISIVENDDGKLVWECPNCGNRNKSKMNIARRTCGYIGTNDWNQGRTQEIKERYVHLGGE
ncbi:MAG: anaerobic ribonucleoside-triphosphate reductase [Eubacteriales bacterium]|nr:anaerobic ribonucleoside-triphosphate reductase [Eubacteriales bacterium]